MLNHRATCHDQPPFQIMKMLYCFINNVHVDYDELLWEGLHYSLMHPTALIPYPRFTKIIVDHFMTENPDILRRLHEHYHRVKNDEVVKSIFNSWKNKKGEGMRIPKWMLTEEMKLTAYYQMYTIVFQVDVPTTQSQAIESTQGTNRTLSAPRTPNPVTAQGESSAPRKPTVIRVQEHLVEEEIEDLVEGGNNFDANEFVDEILNDQKDPGTRIEPKSYKESLKVKKSDDVLINYDDEDEEESVGDALIQRKREKGKGIKEIRDTPPLTPIRSP
ncbi:hypothetical protein Tco_0695956 [Tanacetum coccineum]